MRGRRKAVSCYHCFNAYLILSRRDCSMILNSQEATPLKEKLFELESILSEMESVVVAYSGGVDSALLSSVAHRKLGRNALSVIADSPSLAPAELENAKKSAVEMGIRHKVIKTNEINRYDYRVNGPDRCYFCKDELYAHLDKIAKKEGFLWVVNGTNTDDLGDHRPGLEAAKNYGVRSPMVEAGMSKQNIRDISLELNLATWDKPAQACLASRVPYGTMVSEETLYKIADAEKFLRDMGFSQLRVRHHDSIARIELEISEIELIMKKEIKDRVVEHFKSIGYLYVTLDLAGFRSGSLNEELSRGKS